MILGFHEADQILYVYFLDFSSFTPDKKFKMQRIAFF